MHVSMHVAKYSKHKFCRRSCFTKKSCLTVSYLQQFILSRRRVLHLATTTPVLCSLPDSPTLHTDRKIHFLKQVVNFLILTTQRQVPVDVGFDGFRSSSNLSAFVLSVHCSSQLRDHFIVGIWHFFDADNMH